MAMSSVVGMQASTGVEPQLAAPSRAKAPAHKSVEVGANQMWYGYYKGNEPIAAFGVGVPGLTQADNAIFVNASDPIINGKKIVGLRFIIQGKGEIYDVSGWLSADLNIPADADLIMSAPVAEDDIVEAGWTEVLLPEPYEIPEEGVYAGYTVYTTGATHESQYIGYTTNDRIGPMGSFYDHAVPFMSGWQSYGDRMGKLCYQVLLEGDFLSNAVTASSFPTQYVVEGENTEVAISVTNLGSEGIGSISYVIITDGVEGELQELTLDEKFDILGGTTQISIPLAADSETKYAKKEIRIVKVNGEDNEVSEAEATAAGGLVTLTASAPRKVVCEAYTGTWCGWCPRDGVGISKLEQIYGELFIPIEAHAGMSDYYDPMAIAAYDELKDDSKGYPSAVFNREYRGDAYTGLSNDDSFHSPEVVDMVLAELTEGAVTVKADWGNDEKTRISVSSDVTFMFDSEVSNYSLAYVVKADGLHKDGDPDWYQANFYYAFADSPEFQPGTEVYEDLKELIEGPELIEDMVYDNVAIAAYGLAEGLPESVVAPFTSGVAQTHDYTISIANNSLVQEKEGLYVVVMLIDNETGRIVNGDVCAVGDSNGIGSSFADEAEATELYRHDLLGRRLEKPVRGVNVVTYSDGSVKKVFVK